MSVPNHSILPTTESDPAFLADFLHTCKLALPINRLLFKDWPNDAAQKPLYAGALSSSFKDESVECLKMVDDGSGEIVGYVALSRKQPPPETTGNLPEKGKGDGETPTIPDFFNPDVLSAVSNAVTEIKKEVEGIDRYDLTFICVIPSSRRHGIGSQLVQVCFDRAKAIGLPLVVCSEPAAHDFFVKMGFKDTKHVDLDLAKWAPPFSGFGMFRLSGMVWPPKE